MAILHDQSAQKEQATGFLEQFDFGIQRHVDFARTDKLRRQVERERGAGKQIHLVRGTKQGNVDESQYGAAVDIFGKVGMAMLGEHPYPSLRRAVARPD